MPTRTRTTPAPKAKRTRRTEQERAIDALRIANGKVEALTKNRDRAKSEAESFDKLLTAAIDRRDYLAADPALPPAEPTDPAAGETTTDADAAAAGSDGIAQ